MVRVERSSESVERMTFPDMCSSVAFTRISAGSPSRTLAASDSGTGIRSRNTFTCESFTTGMELTLDVPAWISDPVSAYRQVTTPSNGAVIREYSESAA